MRKKKILWHSDPGTISTGFGNYTKYILSYLQRSGKFEIANLACGVPVLGYADAQKVPWRVYGSLPNHRADLVQRINADPGGFGRMAAYGELMVEEVVNDFKPDIFITLNDWWGSAEFCINKPFWNKIPCVASWTLDSTPILDGALQNAEKVNYHFVWAKFGETEYHRLANELESNLKNIKDDTEKKKVQNKIDAYRRVKTLSGCVNNHAFKRLSESQRQALREKYGFDKDTFIISTGSRNQLRKAFPSQIEAFGIFKKNHPEVKAKLIHWTSTNEGWNLEKHCKEHNVDIADVLVAYRCRATGEVFYFPISQEEKDNPRTGHQKSLKVVGMDNFATEEQLNEFFNISDVFILNISSGGFELFLSQAKLTEIPTISNSYSCFEEQVGLDKGTLPADETYYYEIGSGFKKATPSPYSIYKNLAKVYKMTPEKRREIGKAGRDFVLKNYSIEVVAKQWEDLLDSIEPTNYDFNPPKQELNPQGVIENIQDNREWVRQLYRRILGLDPSDEDSGLIEWTAKLGQGAPRHDIEGYFRAVALEDQNKKKAENPDNDLGPEPAEERVLITIPESLGDCLYVSCLLKDARELYPDKKIYVATKPDYFDVFQPLIGQYIDYVIPWRDMYNFPYSLEGASNNKKLFQIVLGLHHSTQININYLRNAEDKTKINVAYE